MATIDHQTSRPGAVTYEEDFTTAIPLSPLSVFVSSSLEQTSSHSRPGGIKCLLVSSIFPREVLNLQPTSSTPYSVEMYTRASVLLFPVYALASLAAAAPGALDARGGSSCTSGSTLCCKTVVSVRIVASPAILLPALLWTDQLRTQDNAAGVALIEALVGATIDPVIGPLLATGCIATVGSCIGQTVRILTEALFIEQSRLRWLQQHRFVVGCQGEKVV